MNDPAAIFIAALFYYLYFKELANLWAWLRPATLRSVF